MISQTTNLHKSIVKNNLSQYNLEENVTEYKECCIVITQTGFRTFGEEYADINDAYRRIDTELAKWETQNKFFQNA